jgi:hypothetical protein
MSSFTLERKAQAYTHQTTPDCIYRRVDTGQWFNVEHEIMYNYPESRPNYAQEPGLLVHPFTYQNLELEPGNELTPERVMQFYIFRNRIVQDFLMEHTDATGALFILNNQLSPPLDETLQERFIEIATVFLERAQEFGQEQAAVQCASDYLNPRITNFRVEYERDQQLERELEPLAVPHSAFALTSYAPSFLFTPEAYARIRNLDQLLDRSMVSSEVPLMVRPTLHKVLKGYTYTLDKKIPTDKPNQFQFLFLWSEYGKAVVEHDLQRGTLTLSYELKNAEDDSADRLDLLGTRTLGHQRDDFVQQPARLQGQVQITISTLPFQLDLWRELIMNDRRAQQLFALNELQLTDSIRSVGLAGVDNPESSDPVEPTADVIQSLVREENLNAIPHIHLPTGVEFSVKLESTSLTLLFDHLQNVEDAEWISRHFAQCVGLYGQQRRSLLQIYRTFTTALPPATLQPGTTADKPKGKGKSKGKPTVYTIFEANYTRWVGNKVPTLVSREEARTLQQAGTQVMSFPKPADLAPGEQTMYFTCHLRNDGHNYPGLHLNPNPEGKYPLLPCCYKEDQSQKKHSIAYEYFAPESQLGFADYRARQKDRSFVGVDQTDKCPDLIRELYQLNSLVAPVRWGVHRSPLSALECVLYALNYNGFRTTPVDDRLGVVEQEFARMFATFPYANELCAQERWDQPITAGPPSSELYFDLRHWVRLVEETYACHIVLLDPSDFVRFPTVQGRWVWTRDTRLPVVVLYEHYGSTRASYPQCEWIVYTDDLDPTLVEHRYVDTYAREAAGSVPALEVDYTSLIQSFREAQLEPESQHIDFYGKVYAWNVTRNRTQLTIFFRHIRLPPLHLPRATDVFFGRVDEWAVGESGSQQFLRLGTFECAVLTQPLAESARERYQFTRVQVDLLTENAKRVYAQRVDSGQALDDWSFIRVNLDEAYRPLNRFFFESDGTIYVPNAQSKARLEYFLRLYRRRRTTEWMEYLSATTVPFKYQSVSDFQEQENAIVLDNDHIADWKYVQYAPVELTGVQKPIREPFLIWVDHTLYRCTWMGELESAIQRVGESEAYRLFFPQSRRIFIVGDPEAADQGPTFVATKHVVTQELTLYRCTRFQTV